MHLGCIWVVVYEMAWGRVGVGRIFGWYLGGGLRRAGALWMAFWVAD